MYGLYKSGKHPFSHLLPSPVAVFCYCLKFVLFLTIFTVFEIQNKSEIS